MKEAVLYARGYSAPTQIKLLREYAENQDTGVVREFVEEPRTVKATGRRTKDTIKQAVLFARVACEEQGREGYAIRAQIKHLREYAEKHDIRVVRKFAGVGAAGGKLFEEMVSFLRANKQCRIILVENIDRLYRNLRDGVTLEELDLEIHLAEVGQVVSKGSKLAPCLLSLIVKMEQQEKTNRHERRRRAK